MNSSTISRATQMPQINSRIPSAGFIDYIRTMEPLGQREDIKCPEIDWRQHPRWKPLIESTSKTSLGDFLVPDRSRTPSPWALTPTPESPPESFVHRRRRKEYVVRPPVFQLQKTSLGSTTIHRNENDIPLRTSEHSQEQNYSRPLRSSKLDLEDWEVASSSHLKGVTSVHVSPSKNSSDTSTTKGSDDIVIPSSNKFQGVMKGTIVVWIGETVTKEDKSCDVRFGDAFQIIKIGRYGRALCKDLSKRTLKTELDRQPSWKLKLKKSMSKLRLSESKSGNESDAGKHTVKPLVVSKRRERSLGLPLSLTTPLWNLGSFCAEHDVKAEGYRKSS